MASVLSSSHVNAGSYSQLLRLNLEAQDHATSEAAEESLGTRVLGQTLRVA